MAGNCARCYAPFTERHSLIPFSSANKQPNVDRNTKSPRLHLSFSTILCIRQPRSSCERKVNSTHLNIIATVIFLSLTNRSRIRPNVSQPTSCRANIEWARSNELSVCKSNLAPSVRRPPFPQRYGMHNSFRAERPLLVKGNERKLLPTVLLQYLFSNLCNHHIPLLCGHIDHPNRGSLLKFVQF